MAILGDLFTEILLPYFTVVSEFSLIIQELPLPQEAQNLVLQLAQQDQVAQCHPAKKKINPVVTYLIKHHRLYVSFIQIHI